MATITHNFNINDDPRFLFDLSFYPIINIEENNDDIDKRIDVVKNKIQYLDVNILEEYQSKFQLNNISLNEYEWIDFNNPLLCYFIWFTTLTLFKDRNNTQNNLDLQFNFKSLLKLEQPSIFSTNKPIRTFPNFTSNKSTLKSHTIIFIHYTLNELFINNVNDHVNLIKCIKNKYVEFYKSRFFNLTLKENAHRARWTINKLSSVELRFHQEAPLIEYYEFASLAISLFLWDRKSDFEPVNMDQEKYMSKNEYLHKLNLSWNQYIHRENNKRNKVKAYNFEMSTSLSEKIKFLTKKLDKKQNKLIEDLIEKEFEKYK
jgi:hypothetical protein